MLVFMGEAIDLNRLADTARESKQVVISMKEIQ